MGFKMKHLIFIIIVIIVSAIAFYFYRQFLTTNISQCPQWNKSIEQLLQEGNYCSSAQECQVIVLAKGCCERREYVSEKFYQMGALRGLVAKYNKYCSSKDLCSVNDCPADTSRQVVCQNYRCLETK